MALKLKFRPLFPALVEVESPILLTKVGATYRFGFDADNAPTGPQGPQGVPGAAGAGYGGTSTTSLLIANSVSKVFTTQTGLAYQAGNYVRASSAANGANFMEGTLSSYNSGTGVLTMAVTNIGGAGTFADWTFAISGAPGSVGVSTFNGRGGAVVPVGGDYTYSANTMALPAKYWSGGVHSNNVGTPNTKVDVAAGVWRDSTDSFNIIGTAKTIDFAVNGAVDRLDTGTIAAGARYYTFAIAKADGTSGTLASLSPTAPTLPASYVYFRRIGMVKTDGSAHILPFTHVNNYWYYSTAVRDITSAAMTAGTVTAKVLASVPFVQGVIAIFSPTIIPASGTSIIFDVMPGFLPDTAVTGWRQDFEGPTALQFVLRIPVDSSGQIKYRAGTVNHTLTVDVAGWIDDL